MNHIFLNVLVAILLGVGSSLLTASSEATESSKHLTDRYKALADLWFEGGYPTEETSSALNDELYFQRAVQAYLWALPAVNMYAMKEGLGKAFGEGYNVVPVFEKRLKPNTIITTPNSDVIYGLGFADLSKTGPLVLEAPANLQGLMDDFWHRPLVGPEKDDGTRYLGDIGLPGPDKGKGKRLAEPSIRFELFWLSSYIFPRR